MAKKVKRTVYLVRHATYETETIVLPGRLPIPLSDEGIKQAELLKNYFSNKNIDKIYSSAVLRAKQTAEIMSGGKIPIKYDLRLLETMSSYQGYWSQDFVHFYSHRQELGGETNKDIQDRIVSFWNEVVVPSKENFIICSHGDPIDFLYEYLAKIPLDSEPTPFEEWPESPHYPPKGAVRPISFFDDGRFELGEIITQKELAE